MGRLASGGADRRARRLAFSASALAALLVAAAVVWHGAAADFVDAAPSQTVTASTTTLTLTDDDSAVRLFNLSELRPGATATRCVRVSTTSPRVSTVRLYGTGRSSTKGLSSAINLRILVGTAGSNTNCGAFTTGTQAYNGTLAAFPTDSFAAGVGSWSSTAGTTSRRTYQITYTLSASAPTSAEGGTATLSFVWEAQL